MTTLYGFGQVWNKKRLKAEGMLMADGSKEEARDNGLYRAKLSSVKLQGVDCGEVARFSVVHSTISYVNSSRSCHFVATYFT